jgi:hypothetical protein
MARWSEGGWKNSWWRIVAGKNICQRWMEEAPHNSTELSHSAHANGMNRLYSTICWTWKWSHLAGIRYKTCLFHSQDLNVHNFSFINTSKNRVLLATQIFAIKHANIIIKIISAYALPSSHILHNSCHIFLEVIRQLLKLKKVTAANIHKTYQI